MNKHIITLLLFEINKRLEQMQRRGIGHMEKSQASAIEYRIDDTVYEITVKAKSAPKASKAKKEEVESCKI